MWAAAKNWPPSVWRCASALSAHVGRSCSIFSIFVAGPRLSSVARCLQRSPYDLRFVLSHKISLNFPPVINCPRLTHTSTLYMTFCVLSISELSLSVRTPRRSISHAHKRLHTHSLHIKNAAASAARPMHALLLLLLLTVSSSLFSQQASPSV